MTVKTRTSTLPQDANGHDIQAPSKFQMQDATATPILSPKTVSSTEIDLKVPENAVTLVLTAIGADLRVAITDAGTASAPYYVLKDGKTEAFPVAAVSGNGATSVFLLRDAAVDVVVHFRFEMIGN